MIAVVLHVIAITALSIIYVQHEKQSKDTGPISVGISEKKAEEKKEEIAAPQDQLDRNEIPKPKTDKDAEMVSTDTPDLLTDPTQKPDDNPDFTKEAGTTDPDSIPGAPSGGTSIGVGAGKGGHFGTGRPSAFVGRTAGTGTGIPGRAVGATIKTQTAVMLGLRWLCRHQQKDGSWAADKLAEVCDAKGGCCEVSKEPQFSNAHNEGLTGLALLAFLGAGHSHNSKITLVDTIRGKPHKLGEVVKNGLKWLRDRQAAHKDGRFSDDGEVYNEALATLAMCEAYGMSMSESSGGTKAWRDCAEKGIKFLLDSQRRDPRDPSENTRWGWRYQPRAWFDSDEAKKSFANDKERYAGAHEADISATTWAVMALKDAEIVGIDVPKEAMDGALNFVKYVTVKDKDVVRGVAYQDPMQVGRKIMGEGDQFDFHPTTLQALGMCCRTFITKDPNDPVLPQSAAAIVKDLPTVSKNKLSVDYYYWYYASLALNQFDAPGSPSATGKYWNKWNEALQEALLSSQDESKTCASGSWTIPDRWSPAGGPIYRTALNVLTLEVYYRYENAFGSSSTIRKQAAKEEKGRDERGREDEKKPDEKKPK